MLYNLYIFSLIYILVYYYTVVTMILEVYHTDHLHVFSILSFGLMTTAFTTKNRSDGMQSGRDHPPTSARTTP